MSSRLATTAKRLNLSCGGSGTWQKLGEKHRHMEGSLRARDALCSMRQPLGLGLASGVVAADGAIARREKLWGGWHCGPSAGRASYEP